MGIATGKLVDELGIVGVRAIIEGVCETVVALADDLIQAALLPLSRSGKGE